MRLKFLWFSFLVLASLSVANAQQALKANKHLEKGNLEKVKKILEKNIRKDPADPANHYMLARYYVHPDLPYEAIDSAHIHIQVARDGFALSDSRNKDRFIRKGMDSLKIGQLSNTIDSMAFQKAKEIDSVNAYQHFIDNYPDAIQIEEAIILRNDRAYELALQTNTPAAMQDFFNKYPNARQANLAKDAFEALYFEQQTKDKTAEAYKRYLQQRPNANYTNKAALSLLKIQSAGASKQTFIDFVTQYPNTSAARLAGMLLESFKEEKINPELLTHYKNGVYSFFNIAEKRLLDFQLQSVIPDSCRWIQKPLIHVEKEGTSLWYLKNGAFLLGKPLEELVYMGSGFYKLKEVGSTQKQLLHLSNDSILFDQALDFTRVDDFTIGKKTNAGWQLVSLLGEEMLSQAVDSIWKTNKIYFFKKSGKIAVATSNDLKKKGTDDLKTLSLLYNNYQLHEGEQTWLASDDFETVLNATLEPVIPLQKATIQKIPQGWTILKNGEYEILNQDFKPLYNTTFEDVKAVQDVLALKTDNKWAIIAANDSKFPFYKYDSVRLFNNWVAYASGEAGNELIFHKGQKIPLEEGEIFRILKTYNEEVAKVAGEVRFLAIINSKNYHRIYNGSGKLIEQGVKLETSVITPKLLYVSEGNRQVLIDSTGSMVTSERGATFGNLQKGLVPMLKNRKFGAFLVDEQVMIPYKSDIKLRSYIPGLYFIFSRDNALGIMDKAGKEVLSAEFSSIEYMSDSLAFVGKDGKVELINIFTSAVIFENITDKEQVNFKQNDYYLLRIDSGYGMIDNKAETLIPFNFNSLEYYQSDSTMLWIAERSVPEMNYQLMAYYDKTGSLLFREGFTSEEYLKTVCD